jgi:hypothetical protein
MHRSKFEDVADVFQIDWTLAKTIQDLMNAAADDTAMRAVIPTATTTTYTDTIC